VARLPIVSVKPVALKAPGRGERLKVRISAPTTGSELPIIVFSHGFGSSLDGVLGHDRFAVVGHDIGMWTAYARAADTPDPIRVSTLLTTVRRTVPAWSSEKSCSGSSAS
jgi:hypothetical protein